MVAILSARMIGGRRLLAKLRQEAVAVDPASQQLLADCRRRWGLPGPEPGNAPRGGLARDPGRLSASRARAAAVGPLARAAPQGLPACTSWRTSLGEMTAAKLIGELVRIPFFFHPLVLWLLGRLDCERELLCDEAVVNLGADPVSYARLLLRSRQAARPAPALRRLHSVLAGFLSLTAALLRPASSVSWRLTCRARFAHSPVDDCSFSGPSSSPRVWAAASLRVGAVEPRQEPRLGAHRRPLRNLSRPPRMPRAIKGMVLGPDEEPVAGATVVAGLEETGKANHQVFTTDAEGRFVWPLPPGPIFTNLYAYKEGWTRRPLASGWKPDEAEQEVELRLARPRLCAGMLVDGSDKPLAGASVRIEMIAQTSSSRTSTAPADLTASCTSGTRFSLAARWKNTS